MSSPLFGSAEDVGYLHTSVLLSNYSKPMTVMLSTKGTTTLLICPEEYLLCDHSDGECALDDATFVQSFVDATASGHYIRKASICLGAWCSPVIVPPPRRRALLSYSSELPGNSIELTSSKLKVEVLTELAEERPSKQMTSGRFMLKGSKEAMSSKQVDSELLRDMEYSDKKEATKASRRRNVESKNQEDLNTTRLLPKLGCAETLQGSLKDTVEAGVWSLGPGGIHPNELTLCFGSKRLAGRISPSLEADGKPIPWISFTSNFVLTISDATVAPLQFLSPDTSLTNLSGESYEVRIDFSSTYSFLTPKWFQEARRSLDDACTSLDCKGYRDHSDGGALACFRLSHEGLESYMPDLEWHLGADTTVVVPPSRYLFTTDDGSRCIGIFESNPIETNLSVMGLNMLIGLRLRIDFGNDRLKLDACNAMNTIPGDDTGNDMGMFISGSSWTDTAKGLLGFIAFVAGLALGLACAVQVRRRSSFFGANKSKSVFRVGSFIKNAFSSRKQTFRTVKFDEIGNETVIDGDSGEAIEIQLSDETSISPSKGPDPTLSTRFVLSKSDDRNRDAESSERSPLKTDES